MRLASIVLVLLASSAGSVAAQQWVKCASENGFCDVAGSAVVHYGAGKQWTQRRVSGRVACNNQTFGDPAVGKAKACYVEAASGGDRPAVKPEWISCAAEDGVCRFQGTRSVSYGAGKQWRYRIATNSIRCTNAAFGGDPAVGVRKSCYFDAANLR